jgi:hypothetical protein
MRLVQRSHLFSERVAIEELLDHQPPRPGVARSAGAELPVAFVEML